MTVNTWPDPARPGVPLHPERDGWRPIETAPRDESGVLVATQYNDRWTVGEARFLLNDEDVGEWWWVNQSPGDYYADAIYPQPTRWQPLPAPPEVMP